jgi:hypothetical protein
MNRTLTNGLAGLIIAAVLAAVLLRGRLPLLLAALSEELPFAKWGAAFLLWKLIEYSTSGNFQKFVQATGNLAIITALVIGASRNASATQKLTTGITNILK